jgi:phosphoglycerate dehydrogenase-like enzyme
MDKPVLVLWNDHAQVYVEALARAGIADRFEVHCVPAGEPLADSITARCEILLAWRPVGEVLRTMPRLRWIQSVTAGMEQWLHDPHLRADVALTCARGAHRVQMPENILGALFHLTKPYAACDLNQRERRWQRQVSEPLAGKTLGILGLGAIGQELARKAAALELRVIGTRRSPQPLPHVDEVYAPAQTDRVLAAADYVLLLLPLTAETENFIDRKRLALMRPHAWLLNFARGGLIVDDDLVDAVHRRVIAGAVLDVFRQEPLPAAHPFWSTERIHVLPHIGGLHPARDRVVAEVFVENARRYAAGEPLRCVDRALGY